MHNHRLYMDKRNREKRTSYAKTRLKVLEILGNKCCRCGFSDLRALQIDHVEGSGGQERRLLGRALSSRNQHTKIIQDFASGKPITKYQLLCANCNWIKRIEKGENY